MTTLLVSQGDRAADVADRGLVAPDLRYRGDIDGLRAVAVVAVILFHAELVGFEGGYVGVDVFFVISGYLITQRVVAAVETGRFSARDFYRRRVRRLLPAAASTIALTLLAGMVVLPPYRWRELGLSAVAASTSWSNVLFWTEAGYWDADALTKPLLHTWSLAVEEQFYLVWPALLLLLVGWLGRRTIIVLLSLGVASLAITTIVTAEHPTAAFYLMPYRGYEFVVGAACVWLDRRPWPTAAWAGWVRRLLLLAGLGAVVLAVLQFDERTVFPGAAALVPCLGAAAVVVAREPSGLQWVLDNRLARHLGATSYSLYLVHWPLLVLADHVTGGLAPTTLLALLPLGLVLTELQYRLVEQRFRARSGGAGGAGIRLRAWPVLAVTAAVAVIGGVVTGIGPAVVAAGAVEETEVVVASDGATEVVELTPLVQIASRSVDRVNVERNARRDEICDQEVVPGVVCGTLDDVGAGDGPTVLVVGDSQTPDGVNMVAEAQPDANVLVSQLNACPFLVDVEDVDYRADDENCAEFNAQRLAAVTELADDVDVVLLSMRLQPDRFEPLRATLATLTRLVDEVAVLGVGPEYERPAWEVALDHGRREGLDAALTDELRDNRVALDLRSQPLVESTGATYLPRLDVQCPGRECIALVEGEDALVVHDQTHLTLPAARWLGRELDEELAGLDAG